MSRTATTTTDARLRDRAIARSLPLMPRRLVRRLSAPYIAGEDLDDALRVVQQLQRRGFTTTVDVLGEAVEREQQARDMATHYLGLLERLATLGDRRLVNVSVKLTALGVSFDRELARELLGRIAERARGFDGFVRIDMEDTPWTDTTLELHRELWDAGHHHVGVVLQAYLRRSMQDARDLAAAGIPVRVVKGIYVEPETLAFSNMGTINGNFMALCRVLAEAGCHVAFATHDDELVDAAARLVRELELPTDRYEYQMLLGVRRRLRDRIHQDGHPLRVYIPYGAQWYEYSLRRLRENPRVAGHVASDIVRRLRPRRTSRHSITAGA